MWHATRALLLLLAGAVPLSAQPLSFDRNDDHPIAAGVRGMTAADFNNDGWTDLAAALTGRDSVMLLLSDIEGGGPIGLTQEIHVGGGPFEIVSADFNRDALVDVAVANADGNAIDVLFGGRTGGFAPRLRLGAVGNPRGVAAADVNGDGSLDLVYTAFYDNAVIVIPGSGSGGFSTQALRTPVGIRPQGVVAGDFNNDGKVDLAVANTGASLLTLLTGTGTGAFSRRDISGPTQLNVLAAADFNNDGWLDVAAASTPRNLVAIYRGAPAGLTHVASISTGLSPRGIKAADVNDDGRLDLLIANFESDSVTVLLGRRTHAGPVFDRWGDLSAGDGSRAIAVADFNNDGRLDFATGNQNATVFSLFLNTTALPPGATAFEQRALAPSTPTPERLLQAVADVNHNGRLDVLTGLTVILDGTTPVQIPVRLEGGVARLAADFNGDGHPDIVTVDFGGDPDAYQLSVYLGNGQGGFAYLASTGSMFFPSSLTAVDINRDGKLDLIFEDETWDVEPSARSIKVMTGRGDGRFNTAVSTATPARGAHFQVGDVNRDGHIDLVSAANPSPAFGFIVYFGDSTGRFPTRRIFPLPSWTWHVELGDLDHDGYLDVMTTLSSDPGSFTAESISVWLGRANGQFTHAYDHRLSSPVQDFVLADLTNDGHLDLFTQAGELLSGNGDGTLTSSPRLNLHWDAAAASDYDRDGLIDVVFSFEHRPAMVLLNRRQAVSNLAPVADAGPDFTATYEEQFDDEQGRGSDASASYDPNLDPLTYEWRNDAGDVVGTEEQLFPGPLAPGPHRFQLLVRDPSGLEGRDDMVMTIANPGPSAAEIVLNAYFAGVHGAWERVVDTTASDGVRAHHPNAGAPKIGSPLANPANYYEVSFYADPIKTYKLWLRLKAENNSWANDSVWVQFSGATDASGNPAYRIGTTSALDVNLEECSGCGVSGWGWRDNAYGSVGAMSGTRLRFPVAGWQTIRIQTREDGVSVDHIVLSSQRYLTTRPGATKNDTTILPITQDR